MLISFKVSNFLSFKEETEFSMIAGKERIHPHHVIKGKKNQPNLLRSALVYGANAAGKSNFVKAIETLKEKILKSGSAPYSLNKLTPNQFRLDKSLEVQTFEIEFIVNEKIYNYSFIDIFDTIVKETLIDLTSGKEVILIDRRKNSKDEIGFFNTNFLKNKEEKEFLKFVQKSTNPNKLFLTHSIENNVEWFQDIFSWFRESLQVIFPQTKELNLEDKLTGNQEFKNYLVSTLQKAGTGITSVNVETFTESYKRLTDRFQNVEPTNRKYVEDSLKTLSRMIENELVKDENFVFFLHDDTHFTRDQESDGTQRLLDLAFPFYDLATSETPKVYIIDELERNLHTNLSYMLLKSYLEQEGKGQLIATTHDTHLLDLDLLRRDEIWFAEKDEHGATQLYSLYDFNPRYDKNIEKNYLLGRYGAIPFLGNLEFKKQLAKNGNSKK